MNEPSVIRYTTDGSAPTSPTSKLWDATGPREPGQSFVVARRRRSGGSRPTSRGTRRPGRRSSRSRSSVPERNDGRPASAGRPLSSPAPSSPSTVPILALLLTRDGGRRRRPTRALPRPAGRGDARLPHPRVPAARGREDDPRPAVAAIERASTRGRGRARHLPRGHAHGRAHLRARRGPRARRPAGRAARRASRSGAPGSRTGSSRASHPRSTSGDRARPRTCARMRARATGATAACTGSATPSCASTATGSLRHSRSVPPSASSSPDCAQGAYHDYWFAVVGADETALPRERSPTRASSAARSRPPSCARAGTAPSSTTVRGGRRRLGSAPRRALRRPPRPAARGVHHGRRPDRPGRPRAAARAVRSSTMLATRSPASAARRPRTCSGLRRRPTCACRPLRALRRRDGDGVLPLARDGGGRAHGRGFERDGCPALPSARPHAPAGARREQEGRSSPSAEPHDVVGLVGGVVVPKRALTT